MPQPRVRVYFMAYTAVSVDMPEGVKAIQELTQEQIKQIYQSAEDKIDGTAADWFRDESFSIELADD